MTANSFPDEFLTFGKSFSKYSYFALRKKFFFRKTLISQKFQHSKEQHRIENMENLRSGLLEKDLENDMILDNKLSQINELPASKINIENLSADLNAHVEDIQNQKKKLMLEISEGNQNEEILRDLQRLAEIESALRDEIGSG